jgi:hypothetical protein
MLFDLFRFFSMRQITKAVSLAGLGSLCFVLGAFVMHSEIPIASFMKDYLTCAFDGADAYIMRGAAGPPQLTHVVTGVTVDKSDKTFDGFTLCATTQGTRAVLLNMRGGEVHRWAMPYSQVWAGQQPPAKDPVPDREVHWCGCRVFPDGDLLAVFTAVNDTPYGYGLVKLDKDSRVKWAYPGNVHHDFDVAEDGKIYALTHKVYSEMPTGLERIPTPTLTDALVVLSPEGKELKTIPLLETFRDSAFSLTLSTLEAPNIKRAQSFSGQSHPGAMISPASRTEKDLLHTNSVKVLSKALAPKFPLFKPGQVLISSRSLDTLFVVDVDGPTPSVVWAMRGIWRNQHAAEFLENGHLLLYDNLGSSSVSRVLEYDPVTQVIPWSYSCETMNTYRGMAERLPNGNTLIVDVERLRLIEVTPGKELAWECYCSLPGPTPDQNTSWNPEITMARRYSPDQVRFLKEGIHARP